MDSVAAFRHRWKLSPEEEAGWQDFNSGFRYQVLSTKNRQRKHQKGSDINSANSFKSFCQVKLRSLSHKHLRFVMKELGAAVSFSGSEHGSRYNFSNPHKLLPFLPSFQ